MKKILSFVLAAVALVFTACSNDETIETSGNGQNNKGMVLVATVSQQSSRAAIDVHDTFGPWEFTFTPNDKVMVGNNTINNYYTFTKSGDTFSSADAQVTATNADWYAYYPATDIDLTNQEGTSESAAKLYALAGATETATTGAEGLTIKMKAQAAVLRIVKVDNYGPCDIFLKTKDGKYVSGLKAKKNDAGYEVETSDTKVSVFTKVKEGNAGIYYVIVPAGVKISVWNNDRCFKTTKDAGLTPGKYYTLTSGPTSGTATIKGETKPIGWVLLWIGGPRIATENAAKKIAFKDDVKKGKNYVWGSLWRTASCSDVSSLYYYDEEWKSSLINKKLVEPTYDYQDKHGLTLTGKQPGYTKNSLFLNGFDDSNEDYVAGKFLLSDGNKEGHGTTMSFIVYGKEVFVAYVQSDDYDNSPYPVRPVLSQETVLWGEQDIK
ncbi:hypothetical protein [Prevotella sp.]|uniref:hypothetical protein n=1 Tax=Prevotella sp. TaxID=59823 RepID=UPI0025D96A0F|nr:hypothetical protein [Prevotella sp.]